MKTGRNCRRSSVLHLAAVPVAVAFLLTAAPLDAGWKPSPRSPTAVGGVAVLGVAYSLRKNLGESFEQLGKILDADIREDDEGVKRLSREFNGLSGRIVRDAFPVLKAVSSAVDTSRAAGARLKERLQSVERKIGRLVNKIGGTAVDARAALAIDEAERRWYESGSGILDGEPLPVVSVPRPSATPGYDVAVRVEDEDDNLPPWGDRERGSNPVGDYALRCGGVAGVSRYSVFHAHWKRLMETYSGECPAGDSSHSEWSAVLNESGEADPWAQDREELPMEDSLPPDRETALYDQEDDVGHEDGGADYRAELAALERRRADAERAAGEAKRREQALAEAERRRQEAQEYQRRAAERERRELEEAGEFEEELAASRRRQQFLRDTINQGIQGLNQQLEMLQAIRAGQGGSVGSGRKTCPPGHHECNGQCVLSTGQTGCE